MTIVVLASASPRRRELLRRIGVDPVVRPADVDESPHPDEPPVETVARLARAKATAVGAAADELVIAADTEVVLDGEALGKPSDASQAEAILRRLAGRSHVVITGVHVVHGDAHAHGVSATQVWFRDLDDEEIAAYVATGDPYDKAGGYGIQGAAGMFVERIDGSDTNVIGLPLATVVRLAADVGVRLLPR